MHSSAETLWQQVMALGLPRLAAFSVEILPEIDSTNSELMRRARDGRIEPTLLIAEQQTAGRGRLGRQWQSAKSKSLCFSFGISLGPQSWEGLSLAVGVSLAKSLHPSLMLKWPNDLWWQGRKLAGILIETAALPPSATASATVSDTQGRKERLVVIGIGINIEKPDTASNNEFSSAGLLELNPISSPSQALEQLFLPLLQDLLLFEREGFTAFFKAFSERDALRGRQVMLSDGRSGLAQGVDVSGALLVHTSQQLERVASLEVSVRPQPL